MTASTFVLIPGAGHGSWQWSPVAHRLRQAGHGAVTLTLPGFADGDDRAGIRMSDAVDHLVDAVLDRDLGDVTLVAHSWGGYPATAAAHKLAGRVTKVIFYSSLVPARGVPLVDENPAYAEMIRAAIAAAPDGSVGVSRDLAWLLAPDAPQPTRDLLFELLEPTPGAYYTEALDLPDLTELGVDLAYLLAEDDQVLARPGAEFAARIGLTPVIVPGPHDGMLTHPDQIAAAIARARRAAERSAAQPTVRLAPGGGGVATPGRLRRGPPTRPFTAQRHRPGAVGRRRLIPLYEPVRARDRWPWAAVRSGSAPRRRIAD